MSSTAKKTVQMSDPSFSAVYGSLSPWHWNCHLGCTNGLGRGGGKSGRGMAFILSKPGLYPGTDLAFFGNAVNLFSLGVRLSLNNVS